MKLLARTTLIFLLYASVVAVGGTFVYYSVIHKVYYAYVDRTLGRRKLRVLKALRVHLRTPADLDFWHRLDHNVEFFPLPAGTTPRPDFLRDRLMYNELTGLQQPYRQLAASVVFKGQPYRLEIRTSLLDSQDLLARIVLAEAILFGALLVGLLGLQHFLTRRLWAPFYQTLADLQSYKLDQGQPVSLAPTRIPEFRELNTALTQVLKRNQQLYYRQKEFTENAAHELQTPIAVLRTKLDLLLQVPGLTEEQAQHIEPLLDVTQRLTHLSRSLLLLAHLDQQLFFPNEVVDLAAVVRKQLAQLQEQMAATSITLETSLAPSVPLRVNRTLLDVLVSNLLSNAIRHNILQGRLWVTLTPEQLTIENTGNAQPLPADALFDRFRKPADRPPGNLGLGLPIAHQISETSGFLLSYAFQEPNRHRLALRIN